MDTAWLQGLVDRIGPEASLWQPKGLAIRFPESPLFWPWNSGHRVTVPSFGLPGVLWAEMYPPHIHIEVLITPAPHNSTVLGDRVLKEVTKVNEVTG